jgi:tellurite resistance protein
MLTPSKTAPGLKAAIKRAIHDHEITSAEYHEILAIAEADGKIDPEELALLRELQHLIENGSVVRVP